MLRRLLLVLFLLLCENGASITNVNSSFIDLLDSIPYYDGIYSLVNSLRSENTTGLIGWKRHFSLRLSVRFPFVIINFNNQEELYSAFLPSSYYDHKNKDDFSFDLADVSYPRRLLRSGEAPTSKKAISYPLSHFTVFKNGSVTVLLPGEPEESSGNSASSFVFEKRLPTSSYLSSLSSLSSSASTISSSLFLEITKNLCSAQNLFIGKWKYDKNRILTKAENWQYCFAMRTAYPDDPRYATSFVNKNYPLPFFYRDTYCYVIPLHLSLILYHFLEEQQSNTVLRRQLTPNSRAGRFHSKEPSKLSGITFSRTDTQAKAKELKGFKIALQKQQQQQQQQQQNVKKGTSEKKNVPKALIDKNIIKIDELLNTSNSWYSSYNYSIPFISMYGDSLSRQIRDISVCEIERITRITDFSNETLVPHSFFNYSFHPYLRQDLPCHSTCRLDMSFYTKHVSLVEKPYYSKNPINNYYSHNPCYGCYHVDRFLGRKNNNHFLVNNTGSTNVIEKPQLSSSFYFSWLLNDQDIMEPNGKTKLLLLDTGPWYGGYNSIENGTEQVGTTIELLFPVLKEIQTRKKDLIIFWLSMPPMYKELTEDEENQNEWKSYPNKNILIQEAVLKYNEEMKTDSKQQNDDIAAPRMYFIDLELFGRERKLYEYQQQELYESDHLHWINPGPFSIPAYALEMIFHLFIRYRLISQHLVMP
jgi:hypothetical protein